MARRPLARPLLGLSLIALGATAALVVPLATSRAGDDSTTTPAPALGSEPAREQVGSYMDLVLDSALTNVVNQARVSVAGGGTVGTPVSLNVEAPLQVELPTPVDASLDALQGAFPTAPPVAPSPGLFPTPTPMASAPTPFPTMSVPTRTLEPTASTLPLSVTSTASPTASPTPVSDPCELLVQLGYMAPAAGPNSNVCPLDQQRYEDKLNPPGQVADAASDPTVAVMTELEYQLGEMTRKLTELRESRDTERFNAAASELQRLVSSLAQHVSTVQSTLTQHTTDVQMAALTELRRLLDSLTIVPRYPTNLPVTVCYQVTGATQLVPLPATASRTVGFTNPSPSVDDGRATCPSGWVSLASAPSPQYLPIPTVVAQEITADPASVLRNPPVAQVPVSLKLKAFATLPGSTTTQSSPEVTASVSVPVPVIPVPTLAAAFYAPNFGDLGGFRGIAIAVPDGSPFRDADAVFEFATEVQKTIATLLATASFANQTGLSDLYPDDCLLCQLQRVAGLVAQYASDGPSIGVAFYAGAVSELSNGDWIIKPGITDDIGVNDDVRSAFIVGSRTWAWCWYRDSGYADDDHALIPKAGTVFRFYDDGEGVYHFSANPDDGYYPFAASGEGESGDSHLASRGIPSGKIGLDDGVSSWRWVSGSSITHEGSSCPD